MNQLNVEGLPEQVVHALKIMVDLMRDDYQAKRCLIKKEKVKIELPLVPGSVTGSLSRKDIYRDVD